MPDRYDLYNITGRMQALLAKSERLIPLDSPIHCGNLYQDAIDTITALNERLEKAIIEYGRPTKRRV